MPPNRSRIRPAWVPLPDAGGPTRTMRIATAPLSRPGQAWNHGRGRPLKARGRSAAARSCRTCASRPAPSPAATAGWRGWCRLRPPPPRAGRAPRQPSPAGPRWRTPGPAPPGPARSRPSPTRPGWAAMEADVPHDHVVTGADQLVDPVGAGVGAVVDRPHERLHRDQRPLHRIAGHPRPGRGRLALEQGPRLVDLQLAQAQPLAPDPVSHPPALVTRRPLATPPPAPVSFPNGACASQRPRDP